jgi:hypothetical protein
MFDSNPNTRFPNLGKLSLAFLENLVEPVLGEKAIDEIKAPVLQRELRYSLSKALEHTENRFVVEYKDSDIGGAILSLPIATMPNVVQAIQSFYSRPTDPLLAQVLTDQITNDFPNLSSEQVRLGVTAYLRILREELVNISSELREKLSALANLNVEENTARMAKTLDQMLERMASREVVERPSPANYIGGKNMASKRCFVIMPFSGTTDRHEKHSEEYWTRFFAKFIKPTVESLGYSCERSVARPTNIIMDILAQLLESDIVLAVLTDYNPNVWYELGVRHTFSNGTIMIMEKGSKVPFDIQEYGVIQYEDDLASRDDFERQLKAFIEAIEESKKVDSPVKDFLNQRHVKLISAAASSQYSPLDFERIFSQVQNKLVVIGQNLSFLVDPRTRGLKEFVFDVLRQEPVELQLLICDNKPDYVLKATREFTGGSFLKDHKTALKVFKSWQQEADESVAADKMRGRLEIRLSRHIGNISFTLADPEQDTGMLQITPVLFNSAQPSRPCFVVSRKEHNDIFQVYYGIYDFIFHTGDSRSIREIPESL